MTMDYHRTIRPLHTGELRYTSGQRDRLIWIQCRRSAEDAERADKALLLKFERLDRLSASYALSDGTPPDAA